MEFRPDVAERADPYPWSWIAVWFVLITGLVLRVTNLRLLPPFLDETGVLNAALNYDIHPVMERLFLGKYLGYLFQRPVLEFANDPIWAGRALSGIFGWLGAILATYIVRRLAGSRAALVSAVLLALGPQLVFHDRLALPESLAVFFVAAGCLAWLVGRQRPRIEYLIVAGAAAACACATKVYTAPVFLLGAVLACEPPGGWRLLLKRELPYLALGFVVTGVLIILTALDQTWVGNISFEKLLQMPRMIVGDSGIMPPFGQRIANAAGLFSDYLPVTFWVLLASTVLAGAAFRKRTIGCLAVFGTVFLLYAIVFRAFVATRYFNVLWLPAAIGIGLSAGMPPAISGTALNLGRAWVSRIQLGLIAIVGLQFAWRDGALLVKPESFPLPPSDYYQYFSGWPSGRGLDELTAFFESQSLESEKSVLILTLMGFRHGNVSLPILMRSNPLVRFMAVWDGNDFAIKKLPAWLRANRVFVVVEPMGTPVDFSRAQAAGFHSALVFSAPDFEGSPGYRVYELTQMP